MGAATSGPTTLGTAFTRTTAATPSSRAKSSRRSRPPSTPRRKAAAPAWRSFSSVVIFTDVLARLEAGLRATLPGPQAQERLAPVPRRQWPAGASPARVRDAAGLLLVFPKRKEETA